MTHQPRHRALQVLQRASLRMLQPFLDPDRDVLISVEQIRHRLLALSCLCPGASTLIGARAHARLMRMTSCLMCVASPPSPCLHLGLSPNQENVKLSERTHSPCGGTPLS